MIWETKFFYTKSFISVYRYAANGFPCKLVLLQETEFKFLLARNSFKFPAKKITCVKHAKLNVISHELAFSRILINRRADERSQGGRGGEFRRTSNCGN